MQLLYFPSLCSPVLSESLRLSGLCWEPPLAGEGALLGNTGDKVSYLTTGLEQEGWVRFFQDDFEGNVYVLLTIFIGVTKCKTVGQGKPRNVSGMAGSKVGGLQMGNYQWYLSAGKWHRTGRWQKAFYKTLCCPNHSLCSLLDFSQRHLWGMELIFWNNNTNLVIVMVLSETANTFLLSC